MLTSRIKKVILMILESKEYITITQLADQVLVSSRTVLRELDDVQDWIEKNGAFLDKRKGKGLLFIGDEEKRSNLIKVLYQEESDVIYTPEDRQIILRAQLLKYSEPTKLFALTGLLDVTESTIGSDLSLLEDWFHHYDIEIIRRPGLGIYLNGDEKSKRKAIVALIYEHFHFIDLIEFISEHKNEKVDMVTFKENINASIFELLELESMSYIKDFLYRVEKEMGYQFADNGYIALIIRFSITLKRREFWSQIHLNENQRISIKKDKIYKIMTQWIEENPLNPFKKLPEDELLYLIMQTKGTKLRETGDDNKISMIEDFKIISLVREFIQRAENETGLYLSDNEKLIIGLVKHLRPAIYRMKMDLDIINPLLEEIKSMYPKLFQTVRICAAVIEEKEKISVPDDEIAYLATHIGAVIQKNHREVVKKYQVVVACMYGIGASQLLVSQIEKNFSNIQIVKIMSVIDHNIIEINNEGLDLLITTVPIKGITIPTVVIHQMMKEDDIERIKEALIHNQPRLIEVSRRKKMAFKEKLNSFHQFSKIIIEILNNFVYNKDVPISTLEELINYVSQSLGKNDEEKVALEKSFREREEKGSTILSKKGMMLLHCRADISRGICFEVILLEKAIIMDQGVRQISVDTIVVMVAPVLHNQKILEVLSEISRSIITGELSNIIKEGMKEDVESELNEILEKFYQKLVMNPDQEY